MIEIYYLENLNQLKVLSDPSRVNILWELHEYPKTGKMLADQLELPPSKMRYHLKELENAGLVYIEKTEEKNAILQKLYRPIAKVISLEKIVPIINGDNDRVTNVLIESAFLSLDKTKSLLKKVETNVINRNNLIQGYETLFLYEEEYQLLKEKISEIKILFSKNRSNAKGKNKYHINITVFPTGERV